MITGCAILAAIAHSKTQAALQCSMRDIEAKFNELLGKSPLFRQQHLCPAVGPLINTSFQFLICQPATIFDQPNSLMLDLCYKKKKPDVVCITSYTALVSGVIEAGSGKS